MPVISRSFAVAWQGVLSTCVIDLASPCLQVPKKIETGGLLQHCRTWSAGWRPGSVAVWLCIPVHAGGQLPPPQGVEHLRGAAGGELSSTCCSGALPCGWQHLPACCSRALPVTDCLGAQQGTAAVPRSSFRSCMKLFDSWVHGYTELELGTCMSGSIEFPGRQLSNEDRPCAKLHPAAAGGNHVKPAFCARQIPTSSMFHAVAAASTALPTAAVEGWRLVSCRTL